MCGAGKPPVSVQRWDLGFRGRFVPPARARPDSRWLESARCCRRRRTVLVEPRRQWTRPPPGADGRGTAATEGGHVLELSAAGLP